ncbi:hypothetical protein DQ237_04755 [Blastococcus sp. TF02-8]|uniref:hypothetical protein n=1 Tax=Blastococcus sp. TF02-8 TaxID=2250574 RepID=UPI000DE91368|nr:hypothetical protein [Blastococcus sp. TF02-8]RBY96923.1 hypothetical protein DQ237_04755 [Blastococcus sp. TF02-8]
MTTEHDLDTRLLAARGVRAEDLPALPEAFLDYLHTTGDEQPTATTAPGRVLTTVPAAETPASVLAAQQLVADARQRRSGTTAPRRRRPTRKTVLRMGAAVLAVAAAWTTAVVVAPAEPPSGEVAAPSESPVSPDHGIRLVAAQQLAFPLSLEPAPEDLTPTFSRVGGEPLHEGHPLVYTADYFNATTGDRLLINLFPEDPRTWDSGWSEGEAAGTVTVHGAAADLRRGNGFASLIWERPDGQWVRIMGEDAYGESTALVAAAETVVDRPQPTNLQFTLAPAGWSVSGYEESRSLDLTNDTDPTQMLRLSVYDPGPGTTIDNFLDGTTFLASPAESVTIQGRPGWLALANGDPGYPDYWYTVGQLHEGQLFLLLAPLTLTQEQVVQIADQVTYTP